MIHNILSIAGTDPTGGAGIQADLKTFGALKTYGMAVITAIVAQNTQGVRSFFSLDPQLIADQIDCVFEDVRVDAVKIGMVATATIAEIICSRLRFHGATNIVLDPVMIATSGDRLVTQDAVAAIRSLLVPLAKVMTPNLPEASALLDIDPIRSVQEMHHHALALRNLGSEWVILKGGHLKDLPVSPDVLCGGGRTIEFSAPRIDTKNDHGTGCTLSAAIAALLPTQTVDEAMYNAKQYLNGSLSAGDELDVGRGRGPLHHFYALEM